MPRPEWRGYFNKQKSPALRIMVSGPRDAKEYEGILDTGFTGFLSMPLEQAQSLGLEPHATMPLRYADGATFTRALAKGSVKVKEETRSGLVILEPEFDELLLGMSFLRLFNRALIVSRHGVALADEDQWADRLSGEPSTDTPKSPDTT